ncbi:MAG: accessory Sec system protein Asp2 [Pseudobutyrivibrio sp.]|nr:accessory Sec system protein Asp2 [Pseudobutyrivibrio sp.]
MDIIKILQIGNEDWNEKYTIPENVKVYFCGENIVPQKQIFDIAFVERNLDEQEAKIVYAMTATYAFFALEGLDMNEPTNDIYVRRMGQTIAERDVQDFLLNDARNYFATVYGEKFIPNTIGIAQGFRGKISWQGNYSVSLEGDYGDHLNQIAFWRGNVPLEVGQAVEFWLEYKKSEDVRISLSIKEFATGTLDDLINSWYFSEEELQNPIIIEGTRTRGSVFCSINACGRGKLDVVALHDRYSRRGIGTLMVGGERHVTSEREEIFSYFDPGDMKPPLAVYFSGYKTREGFEGYYMMRKLGCPFLLIAEQRFEGGGFYLGSKEFEKLMLDVIDEHLNKLGFYPEQLILSGISMGSIGSVYYGCDIRPHALILGKPLVSLGDIAKNERLKRPKGFPTSLDLLNKYGGGMDEKAIQTLDNKVWAKIRNTDFSHTKIIVSYMFEDDYDTTAYNKLLTELNSAGVQVYGKGLHGRHNDNSAGIAAWFKGQYNRVLKEDYGR